MWLMYTVEGLQSISEITLCKQGLFSSVFAQKCLILSTSKNSFTTTLKGSAQVVSSCVSSQALCCRVLAGFWGF